MSTRPKNLRDLRQSGYQPTSVKSELRRNLLAKLKSGQALFPGIVGYEETVFPQIVAGILSQHDLLFLGLRGQGKTRLLRMLTTLLDEAIPVVEGSEINDDPLSPLSKYAREKVASLGDDCPITWLGRDERYHEKLATPDVTIADLVGELDLVKHAEGRHLANEDVLHFGLIPRSHRGIFCMNELPDLSPKIQVGLFNMLEERDIQIRGFPVRLNLDVCMVFSANPEDYTNRGRLVTPLKDRIGSVIRTHYPLTRELGVQIINENAWTARDGGIDVFVPDFLKDIVEETSRLARTSPHVNPASGVSVRMSIANYENLVSSAERRAAVAGLTHVCCRPSDLPAAIASSRGKMELTMSEEPGQEDRLVQRLIEEAVKNVFDQKLNPKQFRTLMEFVESGKTLELGDSLAPAELLKRLDAVKGLKAQIEQIGQQYQPAGVPAEHREGFLAAIAELVLDGLYAHNRLNRKVKTGGNVYGG